MTAFIVRIDNDYLRVPMVLLWFPVLMLGFAAGLAWNQPGRFFTAAPWVFSWRTFLMAGSGFFVGLPVSDE